MAVLNQQFKSKSLLQNKFVFYFIFILAVGNMLMFSFQKRLLSIGLFLLCAYLVSFFSNNLIVILTVSIVVANVIPLQSHSENFDTLDEAFNDAVNTVDEANETFNEFINDMDAEEKKQKKGGITKNTKKIDKIIQNTFKKAMENKKPSNK